MCVHESQHVGLGDLATGHIRQNFVEETAPRQQLRPVGWRGSGCQRECVRHGGNLYGATNHDGAHGYGNVFKLTKSGGSWSYRSLYDFTGGSHGRYPSRKVLIGAQGNLYGSTMGGGVVNPICSNGGGVVWEITP